MIHFQCFETPRHSLESNVEKTFRGQCRQLTSSCFYTPHVVIRARHMCPWSFLWSKMAPQAPLPTHELRPAPSSHGSRRSSAPSRGSVQTEVHVPKNQNLILTPHQQRVHGGECICDKNQFPPKNLPPCECTGDCQCKAGKYLKPFARRGTICKCRSVLGGVGPVP